jgi:predicted nucleic acid-binding protein
MILLDTTACIDYLRGYPAIKTIIQEIHDIYAITTITIYEVSIGLERTKRLKSNEVYQTQLGHWNKFKALMKVLDLTPLSAELAGKIYDIIIQKGETIDDNDILIAGIMQSMNIKTIITRNQKHFQSIPNITVISY